MTSMTKEIETKPKPSPDTLHIYSDGSVLNEKDHNWLQMHMKRQRQARQTQSKKRKPIKK
jgi:hypothetical protein